MYKSFMERIDEAAQVRAARKAAREAEDAPATQVSTTTDQTPRKSNASKPPKPPKEKKKSSPLLLTVRWSSAALAVGGIAGGLIYNGMGDDEYDKYINSKNRSEAEVNKKSVEDAAATRDLFYILGAIGLSGFTITLFF